MSELCCDSGKGTCCCCCCIQCLKQCRYSPRRYVPKINSRSTPGRRASLSFPTIRSAVENTHTRRAAPCAARKPGSKENHQSSPGNNIEYAIGQLRPSVTMCRRMHQSCRRRVCRSSQGAMQVVSFAFCEPGDALLPAFFWLQTLSLAPWDSKQHPPARPVARRLRPTAALAAGAAHSGSR